MYEFQIVETYVCQSFQTLYEASPIINITQRSFAVFYPIMYVTHRSFAAPARATRDFFWLYHTYSLLRGGFYNASSGFGLWAKTLRGQFIINWGPLLESPETFGFSRSCETHVHVLIFWVRLSFISFNSSLTCDLLNKMTCSLISSVATEPFSSLLVTARLDSGLKGGFSFLPKN